MGKIRFLIFLCFVVNVLCVAAVTWESITIDNWTYHISDKTTLMADNHELCANDFRNAKMIMPTTTNEKERMYQAIRRANKEIKDHYGKDLNMVWVGATDTVEEQKFIAYDTGEDVTSFIDWHPNQPDNTGRDDVLACGILYIGDQELDGCRDFVDDDDRRTYAMCVESLIPIPDGNSETACVLKPDGMVHSCADCSMVSGCSQLASCDEVIKRIPRSTKGTPIRCRQVDDSSYDNI